MLLLLGFLIVFAEGAVVATVAIRSADVLQEKVSKGVEWPDIQRHLLREWNEVDRHTLPVTGHLVED